MVFDFAAVVLRLQAQLPEHPLVEPAGGKLGIRKIQQNVLISAETAGKFADDGGVPTPGISCENCKELTVSRISKPTKDVGGGRRFKQLFRWDIPGKRRMLHAKEVFIHSAHIPDCPCGSC